MTYRTVSAALIGALALSTVGGAAMAKGCVSGAVVGGVAGHVAGHHTTAGAVAGCAIGHHEANKKAKQANQAKQAPPQGH